MTRPLTRSLRRRVRGDSRRRSGQPASWSATAPAVVVVIGAALLILLTSVLLRGALRAEDQWLLAGAILLVGLAWAVGRVLRQLPATPSLVSDLPSIALLLVALLALSSALWSNNPLASIRACSVSLGGLVILNIGRVLGARRWGLVAVGAAAAIAGAVLSLLSLLALAAPYPAWVQMLEGGALLAGPFGYANGAAAFLLLTLTPTVALAIFAVGRLKTPQRRLIVGGLLTAAVALQLVALGLTRSTGAGLALLVACVVIVPLWLLMRRRSPRPIETLSARSRALLWVAAVVCVILLAIIPPLYASTTHGDEVASAGGHRVHTWKSALAAAEERPLEGWGAGNFLASYRAYRVGPTTAYAHNLFIQQAVELGLAGVLLLVLLLAGLLRSGLAGLRARPDVLTVGPLVGVSAFALHNLLDLGWYFGVNLYLFLALGGVLTGLATPSESTAPSPSCSRAPQVAAVVAAACGALLLGASFFGLPDWVAGRTPAATASNTATVLTSPSTATDRTSYEEEMLRSYSVATKVLFAGGGVEDGETEKLSHMARVYGLRARALALRALMALVDEQGEVAETAIQSSRVELKRAELVAAADWAAVIEAAERIVEDIPSWAKDPAGTEAGLVTLAGRLEPLFTERNDD